MGRVRDSVVKTTLLGFGSAILTPTVEARADNRAACGADVVSGYVVLFVFLNRRERVFAGGIAALLPALAQGLGIEANQSATPVRGRLV